MVAHSGWDPLSRDLLVEVLIVEYGWVLALALLVGLARGNGRAHWNHLPMLCWALVTAWRQVEGFDRGCGPGVVPTTLELWAGGYQSMLGLCAVCVVQVLALSMAGRPAISLGATGLRRLALTGALVSVTLDMFFFLFAATPFDWVRYF